MKAEEVIKNSQIEVEGLPKPHTCPWLMQYFFVSPLRRLLEPPGKLVGPFVRPGMTVVEPGCGFGFVSLELARLVGEEGKVISVDLEPRAVERLEERARKAGLAGRMELRSCEPRDLCMTITLTDLPPLERSRTKIGRFCWRRKISMSWFAL